MYYAIGPVLALLISMKFNQVNNEKMNNSIAAMVERIEKVEIALETIDKETLKKMMVTVSPVAKAVRELQEAIGVQ